MSGEKHPSPPDGPRPSRRAGMEEPAMADPDEMTGRTRLILRDDLPGNPLLTVPV